MIINDKTRIFGQQKILNHPEKIKNWLDSKDNTLITVEIDLTNACNSNCPGCIGGRNNHEALNLSEIRRYIQQLRGLGAKALIFTGGGEPTMSPHIDSAIEIARNNGLDIGFITNAIFIRDETVKRIVSNSVWTRISLDAGSPEIYQKVHGLDKKKFLDVVNNTKRITRAKKALKSDCTVGVGYLTGKETAKGMLDFVKLARRLGVDYAQFRPFHNDFTDITKEYLVCKKYETKNFRVVCSIQKYSRFKEEVKRPYDKCHGVNFCTVICADGTIQTCCHTRGKDKYVLGNLREKPLKEIWKERGKIFDKINFADCGPLFCRADEFNRLLFEIAQEKKHLNFL